MGAMVQRLFEQRIRVRPVHCHVLCAIVHLQAPARRCPALHAPWPCAENATASWLPQLLAGRPTLGFARPRSCSVKAQRTLQDRLCHDRLPLPTRPSSRPSQLVVPCLCAGRGGHRAAAAGRGRATRAAAPAPAAAGGGLQARLQPGRGPAGAHRLHTCTCGGQVALYQQSSAHNGPATNPHAQTFSDSLTASAPPKALLCARTLTREWQHLRSHTLQAGTARAACGLRSFPGRSVTALSKGM